MARAANAIPDVIVVGAGSAGAIVAARVSEDPDTHVLLIDAGAPPPSHLRMPGGDGLPEAGGPHDWGLESTPQPALADRVLQLPRGRMLGGSSALGAMTYTRGHPLDYDRWAEEGAAGWSFAEVLPYFKRLERFGDGGDLYRGGEGPVAIRHGVVRDHLSLAFLEAGGELGASFTREPSGERSEGFFIVDQTVAGSERASTSAAYLGEARSRPNLAIRHSSRVVAIEIERGRAIGVHVAAAGGGGTRLIRAEREIVLAGGAIGTPHLLLLSGIGPAAQLRSMGITVRHDLPGVGEGLQDHARIEPAYAVGSPVSLADDMKNGSSVLGRLKWSMLGAGAAALPHTSVGAIIKSAPYAEHGDVLIGLRPYLLDHLRQPLAGHGMMLCLSTLRPRSRGSVRLASADPSAMPLADPAYLADPDDLLDLRHAFEALRSIAAAESFAAFGTVALEPWSEAHTSRQIDETIRAELESGHDLAGSCRMGTDALAVADAEGRVHGIEGLRIADASLMPSLPSGGTNGPAMMIGERIADLVRGRRPLRPLRLPYYVDGVKHGMGLAPKRDAEHGAEAG
jgi:choline dehydrogenase